MALMAPNILAVNSSAWVASVHDVGRSRATMRTCLASISARSCPPVALREAGQAVHLLDEEHVAGPAVGEEPEQFWACQLRATLVLHVRGRDGEAPLGRKSVELGTGPGGVLF